MNTLELDVAQAQLGTKVSDFAYSELSPRLVHYLNRQGVSTIADLLRFDGKRRQGMGRKMHQELDEFRLRLHSRAGIRV